MLSNVSLIASSTMVSFRRLTNVTLNVAAVAKSLLSLGAATHVGRLPRSNHVRVHKVFNDLVARLN
jgi:hypothetical protein